MKIRIVFVLALASLSFGAGNDRAALDAATKGWKACSDDIDRFCSDVRPGGGRVGACLFEHAKELSASCRLFARHGGKGHELESLKDIDRSAQQRAPVKPDHDKKKAP